MEISALPCRHLQDAPLPDARLLDAPLPDTRLPDARMLDFRLTVGEKSFARSVGSLSRERVLEGSAHVLKNHRLQLGT